MKKCIFGLLVLNLLLAGCWDRRELNQLAITLAIGIDKVEDDYQVSAQVVVPSVVSTNSTGEGQWLPFIQREGKRYTKHLEK